MTGSPRMNEKALGNRYSFIRPSSSVHVGYPVFFHRLLSWSASGKSTRFLTAINSHGALVVKIQDGQLSWSASGKNTRLLAAVNSRGALVVKIQDFLLRS